MMLELQPHHIAEIRDKIDTWPASRLNAKDVRDDCRKLLEHIEAREQRARDEAEQQDEWGRSNYAAGYDSGYFDGQRDARNEAERINTPQAPQ